MAVLILYLGILIIAGGLLCFKGRDLFRPAIALFSFWLVYSAVMGAMPGTDEKDMIISILAGLVVALLSGFVLKVGVFLAGMVMGLSLGSILFEIIPQIRELTIPRIVFVVVVTLLVGVLTVKAMDIIITVATAGIGGILMAVPSVYAISEYQHLAANVAAAPVQTIENVNNTMFSKVMLQQPLMVMIAVVVLMIAGIVVQMRTNHKSHER